MVATMLPVALLTGCAGESAPEAGDAATSSAAATTLGTTTVTSVAAPPTEPVTLPVTEPVTQPVTEPTTTVPPGPPTVAPRGATRVLVLNAGFKDGGATATADGLTAIGYQVLTPANAYEDRARSAVYFRDGWEPTARQVAEFAGLAQDLVAPMPDQEISGTDPRAYDIAVLLGRDRR
jgi:hypothetical protein